jgi:uncharacterized protein with HEPN domain
VSRRDRHRLEDIMASIAAIRSHLERGELSDGLVYDAVRARLIEIGEAVKGLDPSLIAAERGIPWRDVARLRDHLAHRYFDTSHSVLAATVENDLPELDQAVRRMLESSSAERVNLGVPSPIIRSNSASRPRRLTRS